MRLENPFKPEQSDRADSRTAQRRTGSVAARASFLALCVCLVLLPGRAQTSSGTGHGSFPQPIGQPVGGINDVPAGEDPDHERLLRALNAERQKSLVSDTNKLLRLAKALNEEIARTNPDQLTPDQVRRIAAIEKLAHSVREKMIISVRGSPAFQPSMQPMQPIQ
jgi:hypothetical protein